MRIREEKEKVEKFGQGRSFAYISLAQIQAERNQTASWFFPLPQLLTHRRQLGIITFKPFTVVRQLHTRRSSITAPRFPSEVPPVKC